jgi:hypothetical protein
MTEGLRARLAEAIEARTAAAEALDRAIAAQRRGEALERDAQREFDGLGDVDQRIADGRAQRIVAWAQNGNGSVPAELFDIGEDLAEAGRLRDQARDRLATAADGKILLMRQANDAQLAFTTAKDRVSYITVDIAAADAKVIAAELVKAKRLVWQLEERLHGLDGLWTGGASLRERVGAEVAAALELNQARFDGDRRPGMPFGREHHQALWQEYLARLRSDSSAQWQYRPPQPGDRKEVNPFLTRPAPSFRPTSLEAAERDEAARVVAEAAPLHPFAAATAEMVMALRDRQIEHQTAAQKFERDKAEREAMARLVEQAEGE